MLTSFTRCPMGAVLSPVPFDDLVLPIVPLDGKSHLDNVIALLHVRENTLNFGLPLLQSQLGPFNLAQIIDQLVLHKNTSLVEEVLHHVEEPRVGVGGHVF